MLNGRCDHIWAETDYLPLEAILEYWCDNDYECREAKKWAIIKACEANKIEYTRADNKVWQAPISELIEKNILLLHRKSFKKWADQLDVESVYLPSDRPYLDETHAFHAKELKIAVDAWSELYDRNPPKSIPAGGHKKYIMDWLKKKYPELGSNAVGRLATVVNPNKKGGACPT
jgi:hypothetical protein